MYIHTQTKKYDITLNTIFCISFLYIFPNDYKKTTIDDCMDNNVNVCVLLIKATTVYLDMHCMYITAMSKKKVEL